MRHDIFLAEENQATVILNEQHSLLPEQVKLLDAQFDEWNIFHVPSSGWSLQEMEEIRKQGEGNIVFASPIPLLISKWSVDAFQNAQLENPEFWGLGRSKSKARTVWLFCNDQRVKQELPNGKIIHSVSKTGWQLIIC